MNDDEEFVSDGELPEGDVDPPGRLYDCSGAKKRKIPPWQSKDPERDALLAQLKKADPDEYRRMMVKISFQQRIGFLKRNVLFDGQPPGTRRLNRRERREKAAKRKDK